MSIEAHGDARSHHRQRHELHVRLGSYPSAPRKERALHHSEKMHTLGRRDVLPSRRPPISRWMAQGRRHLRRPPERPSIKPTLRSLARSRRLPNERHELLPQTVPGNLGYRDTFSLHVLYDLIHRRKLAGSCQFEGAFDGRATKFHSCSIAWLPASKPQRRPSPAAAVHAPSLRSAPRSHPGGAFGE
jgi:hypothetical protein